MKNLLVCTIFLYKLVSAFKIEIPRKEDIVFEKFKYKEKPTKYEHHEEKNGELSALIKDDSDRIITRCKTNYTVMHIGSKDDLNLTFILTNDSGNDMDVFIRLPDVDKEIVTPFGGSIGDGMDLVASIKEGATKSTHYQEMFLKNLNDHEAMTKSGLRMVKILIGIEIIGSFICVYFSHRRLIGLFENKRRI
ncbi:hypothetical protein EDEG_03491, partial [Edhazardia aedis USNM 41457]